MNLTKYILFSFASGALCLFLIKLISKKKKNIITDHRHNGPQKFHRNPTPRIGGLGIFLSILTFVILSFIYKEPFGKELFFLFLCSFPAFFAGFREDLKSDLPPKIRLVLTSFSGVLVFFLFGGITRVNFPCFDYLLSFSFFSFLFTVFAITGVIHSFNIIDGFNGLASFVFIMNLFALTIVAYKVGDTTLVIYGTVFIFSILPFFLFNYPFGIIFLGDGGAYLIGYLIAMFSVLLLKRHPEVSAWCPLLINIYPVYETIFSILRKKIKRKSPLSPDGYHFHMLVHKILKAKFLNKNSVFLNSFTSIFLWFLNIFVILPGIIFWRRTDFLVLFCVVFILVYSFAYRSLILFYKRNLKNKKFS